MTYGCYNRAPFKEAFWADDKEYKPGGGPSFIVKVKVPFRMSPPCMYRHTELARLIRSVSAASGKTPKSEYRPEQ